jgi:metallo-beta-lactamase family protein
VEQHLIALPYDHWFTLHDTDSVHWQVRLQPAGHVLGSAYVELDLSAPETGSERVVFSGDLGAPHSPILPDLIPPERADLLILESTYGDRRHQDRAHRRERLQVAIERALADQGTVLIPSFSIGRTQELLYELEEILHEKIESADPSGDGTAPSEDAADIDWPQIPILLDSPLASRFTQTYKALQGYWDDDARHRVEQGRKPLSFKQLITVDEHSEHLRIVERLTATARPAIVIAGNGMCSGGRIVNYLKAMLGDPRHNVVFVGYQGQGTPGRDIQTHGPDGGYVDLDGQRIDIRAGIDSVGGYSAHADQADLVGFVTRMNEWPTEIRLIHGEDQAKQRLAEILREKYREAGKDGTVSIP